MLSIEIPGFGALRLEHLVLDLNGTIAFDGEIIDGVERGLAALGGVLQVVCLTADTHGRAVAVRERMGVEVVVISGDEAQAKAEFVRGMGGDTVVAIGNGANDEVALREVRVGIAVMGPEGLAAGAMLSADIIVPDIAAGIGLLAVPSRLAATLRR